MNQTHVPFWQNQKLEAMMRNLSKIQLIKYAGLSSISTCFQLNLNLGFLKKHQKELLVKKFLYILHFRIFQSNTTEESTILFITSIILEFANPKTIKTSNWKSLPVNFYSNNPKLCLFWIISTEHLWLTQPNHYQAKSSYLTLEDLSMITRHFFYLFLTSLVQVLDFLDFWPKKVQNLNKWS